MAKKRIRFYVAVIARDLMGVPLMLLQRASGDFASFIGMDKGKVVAKALKQASVWSESYHVYVGELSESAEAKAEFTLEKLKVKVSKLSPVENKRFISLVGKRIRAVEYINEDEGTYVLMFEDGEKCGFSALGDDATSATFWKEDANGQPA